MNALRPGAALFSRTALYPEAVLIHSSNPGCLEDPPRVFGFAIHQHKLGSFRKKAFRVISSRNQTAYLTTLKSLLKYALTSLTYVRGLVLSFLFSITAPSPPLKEKER